MNDEGFTKYTESSKPVIFREGQQLEICISGNIETIDKEPCEMLPKSVILTDAGCFLHETNIFFAPSFVSILNSKIKFDLM